MLNYPSAEKFFDNCLVEAGISDGWSTTLSLGSVKANPATHKALLRTLLDIQTGADAVLARGKPAEDSLGLTTEEWERRWSAWAASRKAAFYSRAAMLMLGESEYKAYFIKTLRTSHNIVFLSTASDLLQHSSGKYLSGLQEDLTNAELADWWERS